MAERKPVRPGLVTVPIGQDFCDCVADILFERCGDDPLALSRALILLPNNRAIKAMTEAFVRRASPGLLLPQLAAVGDLALDEKLGTLLDPVDGEAGLKPAIEPVDRVLLLTQLIRQHRPEVSQAEALRLSRELAGLIDEMEVEEIDLADLFAMQPEGELSEHWQNAYRQLENILPEYRKLLAACGLAGPAERRNVLLDRLASRLRTLPADIPIIAAGITTSAKAVARLLKQVAVLPQATLILPALDLDMPEEQWSLLGPHKPDPESLPLRNRETHPQFHLKLLLERIGVQRGDFAPSGAMANSARSISDIFCLAEESSHWRDLPDARKKLPHIALLEADDSAAEARAIATHIRGALEQPEKLVALITPDRELAIRVKAQLRRWKIDVDDSAGTPLAQSPPGTLMLACANVFAERFAPVALLSLLKHPLVHAGENRVAWLEHVRRLDLALRGPTTGIGLAATGEHIGNLRAEFPGRAELAEWWAETQPSFASLEAAPGKFAATMQLLADLADRLSEGAVWRSAAGRQLSELWEQYQQADMAPLDGAERTSYPAIVQEMFNGEVVRPPYGGHPRVAIYGLLEARLQRADSVVCAGLNEGSWPQLTTPDPWLSPAVRRTLGLPALDRNIGLSAHDLAIALGAKEVLLTRARRDRGGPTVASRFLLRIKAYLGSGLKPADGLEQWAALLDAPTEGVPLASRPAPRPSAEQRRVDLSITDFDQLKSDPYSFYAKRILRLPVLEPVAAEPSYAWRGTLVHDILEKWFKEDRCDPEALARRADDLLSDQKLDPALRALWQPRVAAGLQWIAEETARLQAEGRKLLVAERRGETEIGGIKVVGRADRIDGLPDGGIAIVDYKTGIPPKAAQVSAGFALQLGLVGLMVERGVIDGARGKAGAFEYWSLAKNKARDFGYIDVPTSKRDGDGKVAADSFVGFALAQAEAAIAEWITGNAAFEAKLHPDYANYPDYDQLMRLQEWDGRQPVADNLAEGGAE